MIKNDSILIIFVKKSVYKIRMLQFSLQFDSGWKNINWPDNLHLTKKIFFFIFPFRLPKTENQPLKVFKRTREFTSVEKAHDKARQLFEGIESQYVFDK